MQTKRVYNAPFIPQGDTAKLSGYFHALLSLKGHIFVPLSQIFISTEGLR